MVIEGRKEGRKDGRKNETWVYGYMDSWKEGKKIRSDR